MKYSISVKHTFDARHYVIMPDGSQEEPHFHTWNVNVSVSSKKLDNFGFVMDFHVLESIVKEASFPLTNCTVINSLASFKENPPTAERLAEYFVNQIIGKLPGNVKLESVEIEEAKNCHAKITMP